LLAVLRYYDVNLNERRRYAHDLLRVLCRHV
jgi:hypothetical protein